MQNWSSAEAEPQLAEELLQADVASGFVEHWPGSLEDARVRWPKGVAVGKLAVVKAPGKSPRLVGDSSVCGANGRSKILERVEYPTIHEVESALASRTGASPELISSDRA